MSDEPVKRPYDTRRRRAGAAATRARICAAAETLFLRDGYARTSVGAVAREAGVAEATVYLAFATKAALLDATIVRAVRDNDGEPLDALLDGPPGALLARLAASHAATMHRAARVIALGESAAAMDASLRPLRERAHARLRAGYGAVAGRLADAGLLRPGLTAEAAGATLYALCSETTYLRRPGGDPAAYAAWLGATLAAVLLAP